MPDISRIVRHLQKSRERFIGSAQILSEELWMESPGPGAWSAAEVTAHVTMVEQNIIERAAKIVQESPTKTRLRDHFHVPVAVAAWRGVKRKSPIPLDLALVLDRPAALDKLTMQRKATLDFVHSTRARDLSEYRFPHPFLGSLDLYDWLRMIGYHDIRHAKQLREIAQTFRS